MPPVIISSSSEEQLARLFFSASHSFSKNSEKSSLVKSANFVFTSSYFSSLVPCEEKARLKVSSVAKSLANETKFSFILSSPLHTNMALIAKLNYILTILPLLYCYLIKMSIFLIFYINNYINLLIKTHQ